MMKNISIIILLLISLTGNAQYSPKGLGYVEEMKLYYNYIAKELELDTTSYPKIRIWYEFITIELNLEEGNYRGTVNYYFTWGSGGEVRGFELKKDTLTQNQFKELYGILIDSMKVVETILNGGHIGLFAGCFGGDMEYYSRDNSYFLGDCMPEFNKNSSFLKFVRHNFPVDREVNTLLKRLDIDGEIAYSSYYDCGRPYTYTPAKRRRKFK